MEIIKSEKITRIDFIYEHETDSWTENNSYIINENEFDINGNIIKEISYNSKGDFDEHNEYVYDENNYLIEEKIFFNDTDIAERGIYINDFEGRPIKKTTIYQETSEDHTEYNYNESKNLISKIRLDDDGFIEEKELREYENNKLKSVINYGLDNELLSKKIFSYNKEGEIIELLDVDSMDGKKNTIQYTYNDKKLKIKALTYNPDIQLISKSLYEYDDKDRVTEIIDEDARNYKLTKLQYDEKDNIILQVEYDKDGNQEINIERHYDENNHIIQSLVFITNNIENINHYYEINYIYTYF